MSAVPGPSITKPARVPWLAAFLVEERAAWIFVAKTLLAMYITCWLAMLFQLEQPATAMITVAIVMHPQSGMVLAKSFYRAIGTLAGSLFGLALMSVFPQQRELFLLSLSLWVAICAGGATLYRNFAAYGFVLAGYTAAIVTLPAISDPLNVFDSAVMRVSEVLLGIIVSGVVSDLIFPERLREVLRRSAREHFAHFIDFARGSTGGSIARADMERAHMRFVRAAVQLEDLRASVIFEDPEARARSSRMRLLNLRYMAASTSFQSVHHLINRLERSRPDVAQALIALYSPIGKALSPGQGRDQDPGVLAPRLAECEDILPPMAAQLRTSLPPETWLEFDTGAGLLRRFASEMRDFTALEASLREGKLRGTVETVRFPRGNDFAGASISVLRTFLTMSALSVFWLMSGWPFGSSAMLLATIFSGLFGASAHPMSGIVNTMIGYASGMLAGYIVTFWLLPGGDGFTMLIIATMPLLMIGPYLSTRATLPGVGAGYTLGFVYILALKNPMVYDPTHFLNDAIAQIVGLGLTAVAFVFVPAVTGTQWQRRRQLGQLRRQVVLAATAPLEGLLYRFESVNRDLFHQIVSHTASGSPESRSLLAWALAVHECGRAVIELRRDIASSNVPHEVSVCAEEAVRAVAHLYQAPSKAYWLEADQAVERAIAATAGKLDLARSACQPTLHHLHLLRSALRDDESAMGPFIQLPPEPSHAS
ncbi:MULTISPECIES: FUSC family protein [Dyella]|uniref:FUSC family protein n=2 Tax=Dyella TaxID=231454 RepID=A0A4V2NLC2_9GAMM|nr:MULTISPECIES: FUSC family protein [Dyella]TBR36574.1 FUSC family protein [Dyella terrae]TCI08334.1 FUSC family protein [Dyella soli]